jgi:hypothetical protein
MSEGHWKECCSIQMEFRTGEEQQWFVKMMRLVYDLGLEKLEVGEFKQAMRKIDRQYAIELERRVELFEEYKTKRKLYLTPLN